MNIEEFESIGRNLYGEKWQKPLSKLLRVHCVTVWRWYHGQSGIPEHAAALLHLLANQPALVESLERRVPVLRQNTCRDRTAVAVRIAIKRGVLTRQPCEACNRSDESTMIDGRNFPRVHAHHSDYNRPLDVQWLCCEHHREWHHNNMPIRTRPENEDLMPMDLFELGLQQMAKQPKKKTGKTRPSNSTSKTRK